jgi:hypothetical protein
MYSSFLLKQFIADYLTTCNVLGIFVVFLILSKDEKEILRG